MNYGIITRHEQMTLEVKFKTTKSTKVGLKVYDFEKPKTVFTERYRTFDGDGEFFVRLPLTPHKIVVSLYDEDLGYDKKRKDDYIELVSIKKFGLEKRMDEVDFKNRSIMFFVDFAQRFSFNASYLVPNTYESDNREFKIEYLDQIKDKDGRVLKTPARISKTTGRIQISKEFFDDYTVPMRMAILLHEYAHFYINENMDDETEADLNGLLIYLGLGYPRIEGYEAFLEVFSDSPSNQNKERYDMINRFIRDFETNKFVMQY